jgi:hypothetical protein
MNQLMLVVVAVVALCYCGGNYCPAILKKNKEMLLGVAVGMALCSFMDLRMEGFLVPDCSQVPENSAGFAPKSCGGALGDENFCDVAPEKCYEKNK